MRRRQGGTKANCRFSPSKRGKGQEKTTKTMLFTSIRKIMSTAFLNFQKRSVEVKSYRLYQDLKAITLDRWMDIVCNEDYKKLIIEGEVSDEVLKDAWDALYLQYIEIVGGEDVQERIKLIKEITLLSCKIERAEALMEVLQIAPNEALFDQLYMLGYSLPSMPFNENSMKVLFKRLTAEMKREVVLIHNMSERLEKEAGDAKKMTEQDFYNLIVEISDCFKVVLKESETSVMAFATYLAKYKKRAEDLQRKQVRDAT